MAITNLVHRIVLVVITIRLLQPVCCADFISTEKERMAKKYRDHITKEFDENDPTEEEENTMRSTKDCSSYKPPKRIQCDISLYMANLITDVQARDDIQKALVEWGRESGDLEHIAFLSFNLKTLGIGVGMSESLTTTWYYEIPLSLPRYHTKQYITHAKKYEKPTLVYALSQHTGNEVIDHWSSWTAIEGSDSANILYVQSSKNSPNDDKKTDCKNFLDLPKSLRERKHVSVILDANTKCESLTDDYEVVVGSYKDITINGLFEVKRTVPVWECDVNTGECFGDVDEKHLHIIEHFLG